jgi:DNA-directed RNA polymerase specialized sigma24 family protein
MSQGWKIRKELGAKLNAMEELRSMAEKTTASFSLTPRASGDVSSRVESYAIRIVEMQEDMEESYIQLVEIQSKTQKMIELAEDPIQRAVLTEYHLNGKTAEQTAEEIGYSLRQIWRIMNSAYETISAKLT